MPVTRNRTPRIRRREYCRLCYSTDSKINNEDVIPMWLRRTLVGLLKESDGIGVGASPPKTIVKMCERHNSALSTLLENKVSPDLKRLVLGQKATVSADVLPLILSWLVKTSKLLDLVSFEEYARGERESSRGPMTLDQIRDLVLDLIGRAGRPLPSWATAFAHVDISRGVAPTPAVQRPPQSLRYPDLTYVSGYGKLLALTIVGTSDQAQEFIEDYSGDERFSIVRAEGSPPLSWPPSASITLGEVEALRSHAGHGVPMGWGADNPELRLQTSKSMGTVHYLVDDPAFGPEVAHHLRDLLGHRVLTSAVDLREIAKIASESSGQDPYGDQSGDVTM